jgi:GNAT superfamily N-acetyltransferase
MATDNELARRYVIAAMFSGMDLGAEFDRKQWPAHVTVVSNFTTDVPVETLAAGMRRVLAAERPLPFEFGDSAAFGPNRDVPVRLVRSASLTKLHDELVTVLTSAGVVADEPAYWRAGYRPHLTLAASVGTDLTPLRELRDIVIARLDGRRATILDSVKILADGQALADVDVRRATLGDAAGLAQLKVEWANLDQSPSSQAMDEFGTTLASWIRRQGDSLVVEVAVADERVVGMAWMVLFERVPDFSHRQRLTADIQSVYVSPAHRGRGVGRRLVDALCAAADTRGVPRTLVTASVRSVSLYNRSGFEESPLLLQRRSDRA